MIRGYRTIQSPGETEEIIQKSRFIARSSPVASEEEALAFIQQIRQSCKDATHNCYAYVVGENSGIMRYSDDGEPGGTAGLPMMETIKQLQLVNVAVVVTRYFGGILLGAGGLIRAYRSSCLSALQAGGIVQMEPTASIWCEVTYPWWDRVNHLLQSLPVKLENLSFGTTVCFTLLVRTTDQPAAIEKLTSLTEGQMEWLEEGETCQAWETTDTTSNAD